MTLAKDRHYWAQLRSALTAGQWSSPTPAKTPKGIALSWSELFRKFNKHVKGFTEVTEIASQTRALALLLEADSRESNLEGSRSDGQLALGDECTLLEEHIPEAREGLQVLMKLEASKLNSLYLTLSFHAYALGRPSECLSYLEQVLDLPDVRNHIPTNAAATSRPNAASTLQVYEGSRTTSLASAESSASVADVNDGMAWAITETIRSICLQGMSHEKLSSNEPEKVLKAYSTALPILSIVESGIPCALPVTGTGKLDFSSFTRFRELWLWIERLLRRAIVLASRTRVLNPTQDQNEDSRLLWTLFSHYRTCSIYWPTKFKTEQRSTVAILHLRALILRARILSSNSPDRSSLYADRPPPAWLSDARSVINEYRAILNICTRFPKAGERNTKVEDFVDLCVAVWEAGGAIGDHTSWVVDILWWATRLTFNSFKIYRHMTRIFYISGDSQLARRTLRLYVQVVGKAWEAGGAGVGVDADTDQHWVETLVQGARMLCRLAGPSVVEDAREAGELIEKAKTRLDKNNKELLASVNLGEGIWSSVMAFVEYDSRTRPARLAHALARFAASIETFPTPSAYYHLAIALARPGPHQDLDQAIASASTAVEGASGDIRFWHLLGLLLTANGQWSKARGVFEIAAGIGESGDDVTEEREDTGTNGINLLQVQSFESKTGGANGHGHTRLAVSPAQTVFLLEIDAEVIPASSTLLQPVPDYPSPSRQDMFEYAMQLRMTQLALAEHVEGAEGAALRWVEVFGWVADRKGVVSEQQRSSIDTARASEEIRQFSEYIHTNVQALEGGNPTIPHSSQERDSNGHILNGVDEETKEPPPILVTPATPATPETPDINSGFSNSEKRSTSIDQDSSKGKTVQQMLKNRVHKSQARISTISRKIGHGMAKNSSVSLRRTSSAPDFHTLLQHSPYQASSIHSRRRLSFVRHQEPSPSSSPPPPPPALSPGRQETKRNTRMAKENRLLSDLWLMSAATFRRLGKIEQAKGAIQEGEVKDEDNPAVWVQLGLYYTALGHDRHAIDAFHKALFISPDDVSATVHLCRVYLSPSRTNQVDNAEEIHPDNVDLAAGLLSHSVEGAAWDVPEAWYFLAKAYALQGRKDKQWKALTLALSLSERRSIRDIGLAIGWCL